MDAVQHFELPYKVRERAKKFYFDVFHWQLFDLAGTGYTLATTVDIEPNGMPKRPGAINGGLAPRSQENTAPTLLMRVTDIKAHLERIRHAGGTILQEPVASGPVWVARFRDPEGNVLGVIQPRPEALQEEAAAAAKAKGGKSKKAAKSGKAGKTAAKPKVARSGASKAKPAKSKGGKPAKPAARPAKGPARKAKPEPRIVWSR